MGWIIALIVGGVAGWLASKVMGRDADMGIFLNIVVGIIGSFVGNWLGQFFGLSGTIQAFSITGFFLSFVGAVVLLGIVNLIKRGTVR
ncbi:GlsB/YeaQ/YmgE family stress response membrane protein [Parasphingorhabdus sp. DH2-15]|uniref:GlsB/YeaQ/YmgE family stress response membrane protein n=1 Tax=Parasphingorhabdus sp. DH2-15 TaxID=3444112 RepID=UPI003F6828ED